MRTHNEVEGFIKTKHLTADERVQVPTTSTPADSCTERVAVLRQDGVDNTALRASASSKEDWVDHPFNTVVNGEVRLDHHLHRAMSLVGRYVLAARHERQQGGGLYSVSIVPM